MSFLREKCCDYGGREQVVYYQRILSSTLQSSDEAMEKKSIMHLEDEMDALEKENAALDAENKCLEHRVKELESSVAGYVDKLRKSSMLLSEYEKQLSCSTV